MKGENNPNCKGGISKNHYHYKKLQMKKYPERVKARLILFKAVESGKISRPEFCEQCKKKRKLGGHHKDYSKPFDVEWLCSECHRKVG